ncbi:MAG: DnaJ domain-containing protein [Gammaproteobacteria bacterium]|nr:DnaJ domain-containing protein [Gammaproteobacteria bacterium]
MSKISEFNSIISKANADTLKLLNINIHATPYLVLGLDSHASSAEIKKAFHTKMLAFHTDKIKDQGNEPTQIIVSAYSLLSDSNEKNQYDNITANLAHSSVNEETKKTTSFVNRSYVPNASLEQRRQHRRLALQHMISAAEATLFVYSLLQKCYTPPTWWDRFFTNDYLFREDITKLKSISDTFLQAMNSKTSHSEMNLAYITFTIHYAEHFGIFAKKIKEKNLLNSDEIFKAFFMPFGVMNHLALSIQTLLNHPNIELSNTKACFVHQGRISVYTNLMEKTFDSLLEKQANLEMR